MTPGMSHRVDERYTARDSMDGKDAGGRHVLLGRSAAPEEPTNC